MSTGAARMPGVSVMTAAQAAQQDNRDRAGRYAERALGDPGSNLLGGTDEPAEPAARSFALTLKPGSRCELDAGRGNETFTVLGQTDVNGRRFLQAEADAGLFEVESRKGTIVVTATPQQLSVRARLVAEFYRGGIVDVCTEWRHRGETGFSHKQHLATCTFAVLHPEESSKVTVEEYPQRWRRDRIGCLNQLLDEHRQAVESTSGGPVSVCECIRLAEPK